MANLKYIYQQDESGRMRKYILVHSKYGDYYRLYNPPLVRSEGQHNQENRYKYLSAQWDTLTEKEVEFWRIGAKVPENVSKCTYSGYIEGRTMFFYLNSNLLEAGLPIIKDFEGVSLPQGIVRIESKIVEVEGRTEITLFFLPAINEKTRVIVKATAPKRETINYVNPDEFKRIAILDSTFINGGYITRYYYDIFKLIPELGQKIKLAFRIVDTKYGTMYDYYPFFTCFDNKENNRGGGDMKAI